LAVLATKLGVLRSEALRVLLSTYHPWGPTSNHSTSWKN